MVTMLALNVICAAFILYCHVVYTADPCAGRVTCQDCIMDPSLCVWCAMDNFNGSSRCKSQNLYENDWCPDKLQKPKNYVTDTKNSNFSNSQDSERVIQIKPQEFEMKLRPGKADKFYFSFKGARNYPVDLYFLIDASLTMKHVKKRVADQSENIFKTIQSMTNDVYLGLGTFVDKRVLPFSTLDSSLTYSFRHLLSLTDNFTNFKDTVSKYPDGRNRDPQEGGLDALAQVMTCKNLTRWRDESRKIIIFTTDGSYHAAGDGKAAGIFQPYDGKCYSQNGTYTKEIEMDYPSVGMINKLALDHNIIVFFLVDTSVEHVYRKLSDVISGSKISVIPSTDNSLQKTDDAIAITLKEIYEKISNKITLKVMKRGRKNLDISFQPNCTSEESGPECNVEIGKEKQFSGTIKVLEYDYQGKMLVDVAIEGIGEKLTLNIDVIQSCECQSIDQVQNNSLFCHGEQRICGKCSCGKTRYGDKCACRKRENNRFDDNSTCILNGEICSGHGSCICGSCQCRGSYDGPFCECNHESCTRDRKGTLCHGHGECDCGECKCKSGWEGDACDCSTYDCNVNGKVCNNRGHCKCGICYCDDIDSKWDKRKQQDKNCKVEECPECHNLQCRTLEECAKCIRQGHDDCLACRIQIQTRLIEKIPSDYLNSTTWNVCSNINVDIGCYTTFVYRYEEDEYSLQLIAQLDKDCAKSYYMFGGFVLLVLILVGISTLVAWKLLTDYRDRKEYNSFMTKNKEHEGVYQNPLYTPASKTFTNPGFRKRSYR